MRQGDRWSLVEGGAEVEVAINNPTGRSTAGSLEAS